MTQKAGKKLPLILVAILASIFIFLFYGKILLSPNNYLFSDSGDGIKNYYTYAYHIKHDSSYTELEGMNYPYGENYLYTDCHPVLANTFKALGQISPFFVTNSIGILNFILILSIFLSFIVTYFLLLELRVRRWNAVLFSLGIVALAPQLFRLEGHLALSYSVAIPFSWLLTIKTIIIITILCHKIKKLSCNKFCS